MYIYLGGVIVAKKWFKACFKGKPKVIYTINKNILCEDNQYTNTKFFYDLFRQDDKEFFQARLKASAKYNFDIKIDSYLLYYLHFIKWL